MAQLIQLDTFSSGFGALTVFEKLMPGPIRRLFYVYELTDTQRTEQRHPVAWHALICLNGSCRVRSEVNGQPAVILLDTPQQCLLVPPDDWYALDKLSPGAFLLVLSNE
ncbi:sugar 3,4-ketoisomerase [Larkinella sp. VNQ87]|uniref:sugar 3,4-ketoisomerase n=1 Tax=Larkinella sp. VNQ87 TaxID=3400921 RepID=UPI003C04CD92